MNTTTLEAMPGDHISTTAKQACTIATTDKCNVEFDFNGIKLTATPDTKPEELIQAYDTESEKRRIAYVNSPEYKALQEKMEREEKERQDKANAILADAPPTMTVKDQEAWDKVKAINSADPYGTAILTYADLWARLMEAKIAKGDKLADIADECSHIANEEGITGFMYGVAVSMLALHWTKGEALRLWHNLKTQRKDEGEKANEIDGAVINPAIMVIQGKA